MKYAVLALGLLLLGASVPKQKPSNIPIELANSVLLVYLLDTMTVEGLPPKKQKMARLHNESARNTNGRTLTALEKYPYPYATVQISDYRRGINVPEHRFVFRCPLLFAWNNGEILSDGHTVVVASVDLTDVSTGKQVNVYEDVGVHMHTMAHLLNAVKKEVEKQEKKASK